MDKIDLEILGYLSRNSRMHSTEIASGIGVATSTVHKRIEKMRESGVIKEFTIKIDPSIVGLNATSFVGLNIDSSKRINVLNKLKQIDDILEIYELLEPYDILLKVQTLDVHSLKQNVLQALCGMDGVAEATSLLTTKCHKDKPSTIPIE